ncbi:MAG: cell division FtsA domain-containing protein [Candidatus Paceibacterota bacterium]
MSRNTTAGIDIGTHHVKVVITERSRNEQGRVVPRVIGTGIAESRGLRHGYIINTNEVTTSVAAALAEAQKASGVQVEEGYLAIGGISLESLTINGTSTVSRGDNEISELDLTTVEEACESTIPPAQLQNRRIIHRIPLEYSIDGQQVLGSPVGLKGMRVDAKFLFITALEPHVSDLVDAVENAGVEVIDMVAAPIAASMVSLSKSQKIAGCVLANIGAETVSIAVFENDLPISLETFSLGSTDITNDIALGLKIPLEEAQLIKHGERTNTNISRQQLSEIVNARLSDIFELIETHLKRIKRNKMLPAGIIITGGGARIANISDLAKASLELPSRVASVEFGKQGPGQIQDARWAVAYGISIYGLSSANAGGRRGQWVKQIIGRFIRWVKQFLP